MQASGSIGGQTGGEVTGLRGGFKESALSGTIDGYKASLGAGSGNITYSTIANVPKAKKNKLIAEAKPMVTLSYQYFNNYNIAWRSKKVKGYLVGDSKS